jgi:16S rRNA G1207 methylase RsmC
MSHSFQFQNRGYFLERYPKTSNRSLLPFSNAELLVLKHLGERDSVDDIHIFNDRFGVWNCALHDKNVTTIWNYASQKKAVIHNLERNGLTVDETSFKTPLDDLEQVDLALVKIPKSVELFELYLQQIHQAASESTEVICGFMTKYFTPSLLKIASEYFEEVTQSLAWKKARLLILRKPKSTIPSKEFVNSISWKDNSLQQYYGVFSSGKIDVGTQYFLEDLAIREQEIHILDLASGNGVIGYEALQLNPKAQLTLLDDSILAIESSKLNLPKNADFICDDDLSELPKNHFDLVFSNPPFHFEHENNIEVSLSLFKQVHSCLKSNGRFLLVANKHLNYTTHLQKYFSWVSQIKWNEKFEVLECKKVKSIIK